MVLSCIKDPKALHLTSNDRLFLLLDVSGINVASQKKQTLLPNNIKHSVMIKKSGRIKLLFLSLS